MALSVAQKRANFRALHQSGCFVIPNPWDIGSSRMLQHLGFKALASTSSGFAWTIGRPDNGVTLEDVLSHLAAMSAAVDLPVNADFEAGFADDPEGIAANVTRAIKTGIAGLSIEDNVLKNPGKLHDTKRSIERIKAARSAIDKSGEDVILVARTEGLLSDPNVLSQSIDNLVAFADAGADCLFAPGVKKPEDIATMVRAVAPKPLNVLVMNPEMTVSQLADLGVRRISIGGALARAAWAGALTAAEAIMKEGSFAPFAQAASGKKLNDMFGGF